MDATDLAYAGAAQQAALVAAGEVSATELVQAVLDRIEAVDPRLGAFRVVLAEQALLEARNAEARVSAGAGRPLLGVPVAIKDDTDVAGQTTTYGSLGASAEPAREDAEVVRRLRAAGAIVVGKTTVPELTHAPWTETLAFGAARNPWNTGRTPGGSSGGSAAAAAAGLCGVALGSDGLGSIRGPASWNGLVGLKPTRDRVPLAPKTSVWQGLSTVGPLARRVADAALFLDATAEGAGGFVDAAATDPRRLRIAVSAKVPPGVLARVGEDERRALEGVAARLRELGHDVVERDPDLPPTYASASTVRVLRGIADNAADLAHPERMEPRLRRIVAIGRGLPEQVVAWARAAEAGQAARSGALWDDVDVLVTPATAEGPYRVGELHGAGVGRYLAMAPLRIAHLGPFNVTGQPALAVPAGLDADGLPTGVQLVGRRGEDELLLALGGQLERHAPWADRRPAL